MRDVEHGDAATIELSQHIEEPLGLPFVESGVRLVKNEQTRLFEEHASEFDKLLLADAEPTDRHMHVEPQAEAVEQIALRSSMARIETSPAATARD